MKTRLLCALCAFFPLSLLAAKVHKITPITTDKDIRIEVMLSAEANESLSLDAVITHARNKAILCSHSGEFYFRFLSV